VDVKSDSIVDGMCWRFLVQGCRVGKSSKTSAKRGIFVKLRAINYSSFLTVMSAFLDCSDF